MSRENASVTVGAIYKYPLAVADKQLVSMPAHARILHVGEQQGLHGVPMLYLWAHVHPKNEPEERVICIYGTGHQTPAQLGPYIGSVQTKAGYVWHVFEEWAR